MTTRRPNNLHVLHAEPVSNTTVTALEYVLELARNGELSSVAIALVYRDGSSGAEWSDAPSFSCLLGATVRLQAGLLHAAGDA